MSVAKRLAQQARPQRHLAAKAPGTTHPPSKPISQKTAALAAAADEGIPSGVTFQSLWDHVNSSQVHDLAWYYDLGRTLGDLLGLGLGKGGSVVRVARALRRTNLQFYLWSAKKFANEYERHEALSFQDPNRKRVLTWSYIRPALAIEDKKIRNKLLAQCQDGKLTSMGLRAAIRALRGGRRAPRGSHLRRPPTSLGMLHDLIDETELWVRRYEEVWFAGGGGLARFQAKTSDETKLVSKAVDKLKRLIKKARGAVISLHGPGRAKAKP